MFGSRLRTLGLGGFAILAMALSTSAVQAQYRTEIIASGFEAPWAVAALPEGGYLVTEKSGSLRFIQADGAVSDPLAGMPDVLYAGQGGLMDLVLHPDFESDPWVYLTWSEGEPRDNVLKLGRFRWSDGAVGDFETLFTSQPRLTDVHYGARLVFLADGSLLLGIGDGFDFREEAQNPATHLGLYLHLDADGTPRPPAIEGGVPGVYSIGHRNPQAVVRDPATDVIYAHEHGPQGGDEINILYRGSNYGWPITSYGIDYTGALVTPFDAYPGMEEPLLHWTPSIAPAGMVFYNGAMFPEWQGDLLVAALISGDADTPSGHLRRVDLQGSAVIGQEVLLGELEARLRDVRMAPDGSVLVLTDSSEGQLVRLVRD